MVRRPQSRRSTITQSIADYIGVERAQTVARTAAEQYEIEPLGKVDRRVEEERLVAESVAQLPRVGSAPGVRKPGSSQVAVRRCSRPVCSGVVITDKDHRDGGVSRSAQDLVALGDLVRVEETLLLQMCVDEPEFMAVRCNIYRTPSSQDRDGLTGIPDGERSVGVEVRCLHVGELQLGGGQ